MTGIYGDNLDEDGNVIPEKKDFSDELENEVSGYGDVPDLISAVAAAENGDSASENVGEPKEQINVADLDPQNTHYAAGLLDQKSVGTSTPADQKITPVTTGTSTIQKPEVAAPKTAPAKKQTVAAPKSQNVGSVAPEKALPQKNVEETAQKKETGEPNEKPGEPNKDNRTPLQILIDDYNQLKKDRADMQKRAQLSDTIQAFTNIFSQSAGMTPMRQANASEAAASYGEKDLQALANNFTKLKLEEDKKNAPQPREVLENRVTKDGGMVFIAKDGTLSDVRGNKIFDTMTAPATPEQKLKNQLMQSQINENYARTNAIGKKSEELGKNKLRLSEAERAEDKAIGKELASWEKQDRPNAIKNAQQIEDAIKNVKNLSPLSSGLPAKALNSMGMAPYEVEKIQKQMSGAVLATIPLLPGVLSDSDRKYLESVQYNVRLGKDNLPDMERTLEVINRGIMVKDYKDELVKRFKTTAENAIIENYGEEALNEVKREKLENASLDKQSSDKKETSGEWKKVTLTDGRKGKVNTSTGEFQAE